MRTPLLTAAVAALVLLAPVLVAPASAAEPTQVDVFTSGAEGYHTFRIPALVVVKPGQLLAICEGRKTGSGDAGRCWSAW